MPVELEYWRSRRAASTGGLDYEARLRDGGSLEGEGFGVTFGFPVRLK